MASVYTILTFHDPGIQYERPRICHIHYPAISAIVAATCEEFALPYVCYPTVRSALAGHYRFLKTMGRRPPVVLYQ